MSDLLSIPAGTLRTVWVFRIDLPEEELAAFTERDLTSNEDVAPWPLRDALGVSYLDEDFIEQFDAKTIREYGLARYLTEANGMDEASVAPDAAKLDALDGQLLLVFADALWEQESRLAPRAPLSLVGRYTESLDFAPRTAPDTDAASRAPAPTEPEQKKRPSDAAMSGRIAMIALLVMALLVWLMIWVAG